MLLIFVTSELIGQMSFVIFARLQLETLFGKTGEELFAKRFKKFAFSGGNGTRTCLAGFGLFFASLAHFGFVLLFAGLLVRVGSILSRHAFVLEKTRRYQTRRGLGAKENTFLGQFSTNWGLAEENENYHAWPFCKLKERRRNSEGQGRVVH